MKFVIEKKPYVSKTTGQEKYAYNLFVVVNDIRLPLTLKGDATALLIGHQLLENSDLLSNLKPNCSVLFEANDNEM